MTNMSNQNQNTFISPTEGTFTLLQQKRAKDSLMLPKKHASKNDNTFFLTYIIAQGLRDDLIRDYLNHYTH